MYLTFKDTCQTIDTETQMLRIFAPPDKVFYVNNENDYWDTVLYLEAIGAGFSSEVVSLPKEVT